MLDTTQQRKLIVEYLKDNPWSTSMEIMAALNMRKSIANERLNELHGRCVVERRAQKRGLQSRAFEYILTKSLEKDKQ